MWTDIFFLCRSYLHPQPDRRQILDSVSCLIDSVNRSLNLGTIRMFKFSVDFQFDVFRFLFSSKGKTDERGKGLRAYEKEDFDSEFFPSGWDVAYDRLGNGCCVDYPITMKTILKYGPRCFRKTSDGTLSKKSRVFYETLHVTLIKRRC